MVLRPIKNRTLETLWNETEDQKNQIILKEEKNVNNKDNLLIADQSVSTIQKIIDQPTQIGAMDLLIDDRGIMQVLYREWKISITNLPTDELHNVIRPFIGHEVSYAEPEINDLHYYNNGINLRKIDFLEIQEKILYLHVSVYIEKTFDNTLLLPSVQLLVSVENHLKIFT